MVGAIPMDQMQAIQSALGSILSETGQTKAYVERAREDISKIEEHLSKQNGRIGALETGVSARSLTLKTILAIAGSAGTVFAGLSWVIKHLDH